jgi:flagellar motor switch protein FliM
MEKILNQDEIDALFHAARDRAPHAAAAASATRPVTPCNFRRAGMASREQLRAVNLLHDTFVRNLTRSLGAYLRVAFEVNLVSTEQITFTEFLQHVPDVNYVVTAQLRPFDAMAVVTLDLQLAFPMIDLLLGGTGEPVGELREVTEVEEEILKGVVQLICREMQATWQSVLDVQFQFDDRQRQAQILRLMPPNERILSLTFEIRTSAVTGMLILAFPAVATNALIRKLAQQGAYRKHRVGGSSPASNLREKLEDCSFLVELMLPGGTVSSRQLFSLDKGSILPLQSRADEPAVLCIAKQKLFTAQPVRSGNHRAAQVVKPISMGDTHRSDQLEQ